MHGHSVTFVQLEKNYNSKSRLKKERNNAICSNTDATRIIILSEESQEEKDKYHMTSLIFGI